MSNRIGNGMFDAVTGAADAAALNFRLLASIDNGF